MGNKTDKPNIAIKWISGSSLAYGRVQSLDGRGHALKPFNKAQQ